jgi:hypothetical protein
MAKERKSLNKKKAPTPVKSLTVNDENVDNNQTRRITRKRSVRSRENKAATRVNLNTDCMPTTLFSNKNANQMEKFEEVDYIKRLSAYNLQVLNETNFENENELNEQKKNESTLKRKAFTDLTNCSRDEPEKNAPGCEENSHDNKRVRRSASSNLNIFSLNEFENIENYYLLNFSSDESTSIKKREVALLLANWNSNSFNAVSSPLVQTEEFVPLDSHYDCSATNCPLTTPQQKPISFSPTFSPSPDLLSSENGEQSGATVRESTSFVTLMMNCESDDYDIYNIHNSNPKNQDQEATRSTIKIIEAKKPITTQSSSKYYVKEIDECGFTVIRPTQEKHAIASNTITARTDTSTMTTPEKCDPIQPLNSTRSKRTLNSSSRRKIIKKEPKNSNKAETTVAEKENYFDQTDLDFLNEFDDQSAEDEESSQEEYSIQLEKKPNLNKKNKDKVRIQERSETKHELYYKDVNLLEIKAEKIGNDNELLVYALKVARVLFTDEELSHGIFVDGNKSRSKLREPLDELRTELLKDALIYKFELDQSMFDMVWKGIKAKLNTRIQKVV